FLPKTAQITSIRFEEMIMKYYEEGYDAVVVVLINSTGSQTYSNALMAKETVLSEHPEIAEKMRIEILDSHCYSFGYGYPVIEAVKKMAAGQKLDVVLAYLEDMFNCCEIYLIGFELRHMKKSGRISAAAAVLGELMGIKPIISLIDGESAVVKKVRGDKKAIEECVEYVAQRAKPGTPWHVLRGVEAELDEEFIKLYSQKSGTKPVMTGYAGAAVASNTGPHMLGIVIRGEARR
ncbi:MAG: DegV family EDD domain-containing protein, partial [Clostridia bacterium]|nr:DegV family EDD domain-containing protein [Clostridia bacterium]